MKNEIDLFNIFCMGVDYGQLLMEEERDGEDAFDGFQGYIIDRKHNSPSQISPRREPHSEKWREAKKESVKKFFELYKLTKEQNEKAKR